jgi:NDP-sugar pyrophosphorylase family protein
VIAMFEPEEFFNLDDAIVTQLFADCSFVWQVLGRLEAHISRLVDAQTIIKGEVMTGAHVSQRDVLIESGARVEPGAYILGPAYIGPGVIVRHGAFVRENVIMLEGSVLGHACEVKNSLLLKNAHAPHFNYVGDSVLGMNTNLGAGTKLSNLALTSIKDPDSGQRPTITIEGDGKQYDTGLAKLGAILGDNVQTGCNAVLNPGCIVGPNTLIYPNLTLRKGYYPKNQIIKLRQSMDFSKYMT